MKCPISCISFILRDTHTYTLTHSHTTRNASKMPKPINRIVVNINLIRMPTRKRENGGCVLQCIRCKWQTVALAKCRNNCESFEFVKHKKRQHGQPSMRLCLTHQLVSVRLIELISVIHACLFVGFQILCSARVINLRNIQLNFGTTKLSHHMCRSEWIGNVFPAPYRRCCSPIHVDRKCQKVPPR